MAEGIRVRRGTAGGDRAGIVAFVLDHLHATRAQPLLFPLLGVGGHVHLGTETQRRSHGADRQAQVAGRADGDRMAREQRAGFRAGQAAIARLGRDEAVFQGQSLGELDDFMGAASSLHRSCHGQLVVRLDEQAAACQRDVQGQLQLGYRLQGGFDLAGGFLQPVAKYCQ
ncbi:hypothetical protein D3C78_1112040 [compost metagenome]